ncbi:MAG: putative polymerase subfamily sigma factor [Acidimicrobiales bacterium]|jgi:DNA-directed RNA polymerase specialized sigma24 family protein|nr:putative polymerase subfamily sigma factor [Acidimicrobiales bacterium]
MSSVVVPVGDVASEGLVTALYPGLRRFAGMVASADIDPDDLVQEALAKVLRMGPLEALDNPGAYLRRTILNLERSHRRRWARWRERAHRVGTSDRCEDAYPSDLGVLLLLPSFDRALLYLTAVEGMPYGAIVDLLGSNEQTLRSRASKARHRLRLLLDDDV